MIGKPSFKRSFVGELQRRNVHRAAVFYAGAAWLLVQIATQVFPFFEIPNATVRIVVIAVVIGFPFAMAFSWFYEWTPQGIKRESDIERGQSVTPQTGKRLDRGIIAVLSLAVVLLLADKMVLHKDAGARAAEPTPIPSKSIAVLPFTDLSPAHDQDYFSDGMAEELLNALAKVQDLKVAGRTSSFSFKGKNEDLRAIGKALGVASILEGSVRKQGEHVRITAQLIQTADGYHLWSETYDGDLTDIFDLQEKIARAITVQLQVILLGDQQQRLVPVATRSPEAYALYLQATTIFNHRDGAHFADAISELKQAIELDSMFARAHARLASLYSIAANWTEMDPGAALSATQHEAQIAIALDPTLAEPHAALGEAYDGRRQPSAARAALETAVALDPKDVTSLAWLGAMLYADGYLEQGSAYFDKALAIDPLMPIALYWRGFAYFAAGDRDRARQLLQKSVDGGLPIGEGTLAFLDHAEGRDADAMAAYTRGLRSVLIGFPPDASGVLAEGIFGGPTARSQALAMIDAYLAGKPKLMSGAAPWGLLLLREPERALDVALQGPTNNDSPLFFWLWSPQHDAARKLPQFADFARKVGWAELWDQYGPPDRCRRVAPLDYVCD